MDNFRQTSASFSNSAVADNHSLQQFLQQKLIGGAKSFLASLELLQRYVNINAPVMISGETGTGKELVARALHYASARKAMPFQALNCGALPEHLIENELFGHAKGAYTDARDNAPGLVALAEGGTLFLDEIDALSSKAQTALLRFLQDGQYRPVGSSKTYTSNVRIVSATNQDLELLAEQKLFRRDLIFRLNVLPLQLPSLRNRRDDILQLAEHFLRKCEVEFCKGKKIFHASLKSQLLSHAWPGNVRELESYVQRAYLLTDQSVIMFGPQCHASAAAMLGAVGENLAEAKDYEPRANELHINAPAMTTEIAVPPEFADAKKTVIEKFEANYVNAMLTHTQGNVSKAAKLAGKERRVFGRLMKKYRIDKTPFMATE